jgi:hypothetical protein
MAFNNRVKRGLAAGTVAGVTLGLASLAPAPARQTTPETKPDFCPVVDTSDRTGLPLFSEVSATQRVTNLGAWVLGAVAESCRHPQRGERFDMTRVGASAVTLTLWRDTGSAIPEATGGSYYMVVTATQGPKGLRPDSVSYFNVSEMAGLPGEGNTNTYTLDVQTTKTGWNVHEDARTKLHAGDTTNGDTGLDLIGANAAFVVDRASHVAGQMLAGTPSNFAPVQ